MLIFKHNLTLKLSASCFISFWIPCGFFSLNNLFWKSSPYKMVFPYNLVNGSLLFPALSHISLNCVSEKIFSLPGWEQFQTYLIKMQWDWAEAATQLFSFSLWVLSSFVVCGLLSLPFRLDCGGTRIRNLIILLADLSSPFIPHF